MTLPSGTQANHGLDYPKIVAGKFYLTTQANILWCIEVSTYHDDDDLDCMYCFFNVTHCLAGNRPALECLTWETGASSRGWMEIEPNKEVLDRLYESLGGNIFETVTKAIAQLKEKIDKIIKCCE